MSQHALTNAEEVEHGTIKSFVTIWCLLLFMTGIEVFLAYEQINPVIMLTALIGLSVVKAALIIAYFMHLKFERFSLFLTLFPMLIFCIIMMLVFMPDSMRALMMRTQ
jgi:cytochrome c oxidase subunit 4